MQPSPRSLRLPEGVDPVEDADDEIFDLYARLQGSSNNDALSEGLGFLDATKQVLEISFTCRLELSHNVPNAKRAPKHTQPKEATVSAELVQDTQAHHHRRGDTGSVVWRAGVFLAELLWAESLSKQRRLFDMDFVKTRARILELGAGTGSLPVLCRDLISRSSSGVWLATDQFDNLKTIQKNFVRNGMNARQPFRIDELDWTSVEVDWKASRGNGGKATSRGEWDIVLAVDCLFNESLVLPFVRTLDHIADGRPPDEPTLVVIVSELRSPEVLRLFLEEWLKLPTWRISRVPPDCLRDLRISLANFVMWCGWKVPEN